MGRYGVYAVRGIEGREQHYDDDIVLLHYTHTCILDSTAYSRPSLVCDLLELYRYLVKDFLIQHCQGLKAGDFVVRSEWASGKKSRKGKRQSLSDAETREMLGQLNHRPRSMIEGPRIRIGKKQTIETQ